MNAVMRAAMTASMRAATPTLDALLARETVWRAGRAPLAAPRGEPTGFDALDALLPQGGWPCAALTELLLPADGIGELALLLPTLARLAAQGGRVVLVAPPYLPYAPAWRASGMDLSRLHVVEADARGALWAFEQCLRSAACTAVLGWPAQADAQALRRLQVAAATGECLGFALRDRRHARNPSPAALRLEAVRDRHGAIAWHVRKCRGSALPGRPFVAASADASPRGGAPDADPAHCRTGQPRAESAPGVRMDRTAELRGQARPAAGEQKALNPGTVVFLPPLVRKGRDGGAHGDAAALLRSASAPIRPARCGEPGRGSNPAPCAADPCTGPRVLG